MFCVRGWGRHGLESADRGKEVNGVAARFDRSKGQTWTCVAFGVIFSRLFLPAYSCQLGSHPAAGWTDQCLLRMLSAEPAEEWQRTVFIQEK
jgi:hypothetical protein